MEVIEGRGPGVEGKGNASSTWDGVHLPPPLCFKISHHVADFIQPGSRETHLGIWLVSHSFGPHGIFTIMNVAVATSQDSK